MRPKTLEKLPSPHAGFRLERRAAALERFLERHQIWVLTLWSLAYFAGTALRAHAKPFWYDEILTLLEARQPSLSAAMHALGDVDWMPPANHVIFYFTNKLLGSSEIAFRIPSMIGFWVFCLCLFFFARRRLSFLFAFLALLMPFATVFQKYADEARSYPLMLACCGIALVSWQAATEKARRAWPLAGLALGIAGALCLHYWAVMMYLPLAGAEAYRDFRRQRLDRPIWIALALGGVPLLASLFLILHGLHSWHPWYPLRFRDFVLYYRDDFLDRNWFYFMVPAVLLLAALSIWAGDKPDSQESSPPTVPHREWLAAALLLLIPVVVLALVMALPPHIFSERYPIPVIAGFALLIAFLSARITRQRSAAGIALALAALVPFSYQIVAAESFRNPVFETPWLIPALEKGPVIVDDDIAFYLGLWYYTPDRLKPNLVFLWRNPKAAVALRGPFLTEFPKVGARVISYDAFAVPGKEFLIYARQVWNVQRKILKRGGTLTIEKTHGKAMLLLAHLNG